MEKHPSQKIIGEISKELEGKKIVLGVTSSVSAYKSIDLARTLMKNGAEVTVVMSSEATRFISPLMFEWATGNKVYYEKFGGETGHISLSEEYDAMVIAPATANTITKLSFGIADSAVTLAALSFLGAKKPVMVVPAMHIQLYRAPQVQQAINKLKEYGVSLHEPILERDKAKFPDLNELEWHIESFLLRGNDMNGIKFLVTAGPTREFIDTVRFISNPSSGKMGIAIASEALYRGGKVSFIHGPLSVEKIPSFHSTISVISTDEMLNSVISEMKMFDPDVIIMSAAPSDFKPIQTQTKKISSDKPLTLSLEPTPKILKEIVSRKKESSVVISFAADTVDSDEELIKKATEKIEKYRVDAVVANNVSRKDIGFSSDFNEVIIVKNDGEIEKIPRSEKKIVARKLIDVVGEIIEKKRRR
ncbi:bifunctional phosphopantothenoylcysteine decarboxylase/phosphopantothenate--cysteine ligase CoaBC [Fervidicoccus fontis]|uniref:Coenzyme A biosynthesis bifunctional protein CoaBC n=1 Tax=Fervidicoccus fontis (strain DSM 19380 / JCM 18336 / VKM B-2539 / Kam940) TaxID=1163730 RepID=I0A1H1_FERFK|nr:bifunctional phosphopantothenoylcysteine decarboxylase/phosphopantothenate--cysteine ligase CoaBC [Fervidicoccus fontis]AFH42828.1 DNA/pantothenate metabolism flavoprotein (dfp) [Fervidicoccus fontis Kam940]